MTHSKCYDIEASYGVTERACFWSRYLCCCYFLQVIAELEQQVRDLREEVLKTTNMIVFKVMQMFYLLFRFLWYSRYHGLDL